ncbi:LytR C-terminal domain-containing protein [Demequina lignilytica]|uniref:LytR C-terminal domain-containing protein n=1 Tax=Demequina lignilytica TaxID=3051663 RepID=A0AB35ML92_9MICO|nr:LytR C-terminal domain-containing protein [Demequina sp. SYSU T0a273]MDN4484455.1 LytR C-terminal domain-containing protein [Demequina sp. SYSU T0a273]
MTEPAAGRPGGRRAKVRRHRRERQIIVFGALVLATGFVALFAAGVYKGTIDGPFSESFVTPEGAFDSDVNLVCPPVDSMPLTPTEVALRVLNGTDTGGLAGSLSEDLAGRGFVTLDPSNWSRSYSDYIRIVFGADGVQQAYTLARQFDGAVDLVLDNREGTLLDVIVGDAYVDDPGLRSSLAPELSLDLALSANAECLPVNLVTPEPAPRNLPDSPLDPVTDASASPSPSASS